MKHGGSHDRRAGASGGRGTLFSTLVHLWPYIWPGDRPDLKLRVLGAMVLLLFAKLGIEPVISTPQEFSAIIAREVPKWAAVVRVTGVRVAQ